LGYPVLFLSVGRNVGDNNNRFERDLYL